MSGLPPVATVGADIPVRQLRAKNRLMQGTEPQIDFAARDAQDVGSALLNTQGGGLYAEVKGCFCTMARRTGGILEALAAMNRNMTSSAGQDLAVMMFSGDGTGNRSRGVLFVDRQ
jgi:hypothetical protein